MSNEATEEEKKEFEKLAKSASNHFIALVVLIGLASLTFLFPGKSSSLVTLGLSVLIFLTCASSIRLQSFSQCPRCEARMRKREGSCSSCGVMRQLPTSQEK
jgi:hypothetical protein